MSSGQVRVIWRHAAILGPESVWAAEAAECAAEQDRFWTYHDLLFARQAGRNGGTFGKERLKRYAVELGLDSAGFNACLDQGRHVARVQTETEAARQKGVEAVPTLFVNGFKIRGVPSFVELRQAIERVTPAGTPAH